MASSPHTTPPPSTGGWHAAPTAPGGNMAGQMGNSHPSGGGGAANQMGGAHPMGGGAASASPHPSTAAPGFGRPAPAPVQTPSGGGPRRGSPTLIPRKK